MCINKNMVLPLFVLLIISFAESYRILGVFPLPSKSHDVMLSALMKGLAERNHQVDVITQFPEKNPPPNYKVVVDLSGSTEAVTNNVSMKYAKTLSGNPTFYMSTKYGNDLCHLMGLEKMQSFIKNIPSYDLVITEAIGASCYYGFGHLLEVSVVAVSTYADAAWISEYIGNNDNPAFVPLSLFEGIFDRFSFWDRLRNTIGYVQQVHDFKRLTAVQTQLMRKYLSPDVPDVRELERTVSLLLVNRHPVIHGPKPITSAVVEVSALHINKNNSQISLQLQNWLDDSQDGVVYFTFGSMVLIETLPPETLNAIYKSFSKLAPMRVLMKIADPSKLPPGLPKNILTLPWIPQLSVLDHKNVRVFITHGGLMSCQEALYFGVPIIGIPLFSDQMQNVARFEEKNMGIKINYENINEASLDETLRTIFTDPKYRENAKLYSKLFKDRPMEAMDTAVF
ncbi:2-hydroxyacylsphingosine 1-beta-galactosyltransferase-like [Copidosoma floridanum]|uniref:2-hydroxyacylsphingosine 1-beta-galactosyltransferase-like n=1 Tax=Copidosoma floridanum TaxID=29053 RepID=UPI000C6FBA4C|nr:2-hydroxyacylsphingosine 1-beta-galactosyltransferase-like [Copidosoma floridanum]